MTARTITFACEDVQVELGLDEAGSGPQILLLPALSSISTREEMRSLADRLAPAFHVTSVDWPGFGARPRPRADWSPRVLERFVDWLLDEVVPAPRAVVAAGHAAGYALIAAAKRPGRAGALVLVAPTWRGPFPTMMKGRRPWFGRIPKAIDNPAFGPLLYRLNVSAWMVGLMAREHVYDDPRWLAGDRLAGKLAVTRARGARHASARFVSGALDPFADRAAFLAAARQASAPTLLIYGEGTPPKSRAEMDALAQTPGVATRLLGRGRLAIHEEYPDLVADEIRSFLTP